MLFVHLFDLRLFGFCLFPLPLGVWEGLRLVIVAHPGLFSYPFILSLASCFCPCVFFFFFFFFFFSVFLVLRLPRLGKRELVCVLFVRLFVLRFLVCVSFLFLLVSGL